MKWLKILAVIALVYLALGLAFEAAIGYFQPAGARTPVLRTFEPDGEAHDRVLLLHEHEGRYWVESGHWFRAWYNRLLENPSVELIHDDGTTGAYTAVPVDSPEAVEMLTRKMGKGSTYAYWIARTLSMYAPIKPVRLDPREAQAAVDGLEQGGGSGGVEVESALDGPAGGDGSGDAGPESALDGAAQGDGAGDVEAEAVPDVPAQGDGSEDIDQTPESAAAPGA